MKRFMSIALAAALAAAVLAPLSGCGSEESRAGALMLAADRTMMANWKAVGEVIAGSENLSSWLEETLGAGGGIDEGGFDQSVAEVTGRITDINTRYEAALGDYQEILKTTEAGVYAEYARLKALEIKEVNTLLKEIDGFLQDTAKTMSESGVDAAGFKAAVEGYRSRANTSSAKTVELAQKAAALKAEKKL